MTQTEVIIREAIFGTLNEAQQYQLALDILQKYQPGIDASQEGRMPWETDEFISMLDRRSEEIRSGKVNPVPGEEVMARLKALTGK